MPEKLKRIRRNVDPVDDNYKHILENIIAINAGTTNSQQDFSNLTGRNH